VRQAAQAAAAAAQPDQAAAKGPVLEDEADDLDPNQYYERRLRELQACPPRRPHQPAAFRELQARPPPHRRRGWAGGALQRGALTVQLACAGCGLRGGSSWGVGQRGRVQAIRTAGI